MLSVIFCKLWFPYFLQLFHLVLGLILGKLSVGALGVSSRGCKALIF